MDFGMPQRSTCEEKIIVWPFSKPCLIVIFQQSRFWKTKQDCGFFFFESAFFFENPGVWVELFCLKLSSAGKHFCDYLEHRGDVNHSQLEWFWNLDKNLKLEAILNEWSRWSSQEEQITTDSLLSEDSDRSGRRRRGGFFSQCESATR